jgi:hypothetical protein
MSTDKKSIQSNKNRIVKFDMTPFIMPSGSRDSIHNDADDMNPNRATTLNQHTHPHWL